MRDQFSVFQNLRQRGKELLEVKRLEYFHAFADKLGLQGPAGGVVDKPEIEVFGMENDQDVLAHLFDELKVNG